MRCMSWKVGCPAAAPCPASTAARMNFTASSCGRTEREQEVPSEGKVGPSQRELLRQVPLGQGALGPGRLPERALVAA